MERKNLHGYLTVGELATLYDMPRQTIIYFEQIGAIKPAYVHDNGYRYYSTDNILSMEMLVCLKKLQVDSVTIGEYINGERSSEKLLDILGEKLELLRRQMAEQQKLISALSFLRDSIVKSNEETINCFQIKYLPRELIFTSDVNEKENSKNKMVEYVRHNRLAFEQSDFSSISSGWVIDKEDFQNNVLKKAKYFYTPIPNPDEVELDLPLRYKPEGLYVIADFHGSFYTRIGELKEKLYKFLGKKDLAIDGDIYNLPLLNHWHTNKAEEYFNRLFVPVKYLHDDYFVE